MSDLNIVLEEEGRRGRYAWQTPDGSMAQLTFTTGDDRSMIVDHTFVPPRFREHGIALKLVERAVADARSSGVKILPLCPYVAAQFRRHPEWADVLKS